MGQDDDIIRQAFSIDIGEDGIAASNSIQIDAPRRVAPSLEDEPKETRNTVKDFLIVVGCTSLFDALFDFDRSFVRPGAKGAFKRLATMRDQLSEPLADPSKIVPTPPGGRLLPPLSIFGHADPTGNDTYNSALSRRRARAVHAILIRDTATWEQLMAPGSGANEGANGDAWGAEQKQTMVETVDASTGGVPGASTLPRRELIRRYMDAICVRETPAGGETPFTLDKARDFLGGGADKNAKADVQGCGEFNPTLILSEEKIAAFEAAKDKEGRNKAYEIDRRVIMFLFKPGSRVDPATWPCPHTRDPLAVGACTKRLWSNEKERRANHPTEDRRFNKTRDTFGCRFYHGIAENSPCEGVHRVWAMRMLFEPPRVDQPLRPLARRRFVAVLGDAKNAPKVRGRADEKGVIRLPLFDEKAVIPLRLEVARPGFADKPSDPADDASKTPEQIEKEEEGFREFTLRGGDLAPVDPEDLESDRDGVKQRLFNLGYGPNPLESWKRGDAPRALQSFQIHHTLQRQDGLLDAETLDRLVQVHDRLEGPPDIQGPQQQQNGPGGQQGP
jgi:hypothetical protein